MLAIKLQRVGRKHQPSYRLVVAEKRSKLGGPPVEDLGSYNPSTKQAAFERERVEHWLKIGAQPTDSAYNLLLEAGVLSGKKRQIKVKAKQAEAAAAPAAPQAAPAEKTG